MVSDPSARRAEVGLTRKGVETRQRIVAAAADLILQQGVAGTTLDDVRAEAEVSSSQIYHYFADKEALVRAVVEYRAQTVVGETHEPMLTAVKGIDDLRAWRDKVVSIQEAAGCQGGCPLGSLGSELAELDHVARGDVAAGCRRWEAAFRTCLQGMRDRGQLVPAADPGQLAAAMLAALQGGLLLAQIERSVRPLAAALDVMISLTESLAPPRRPSDDPACLVNRQPGEVVAVGMGR
jgi:AcrR family transcriptional regulator